MIDDKWITISEAANLTGCSTGYLRDLLRQEKLTGHKIGERAWLIEKQSALELANKNKGVGRPRGKSRKKL